MELSYLICRLKLVTARAPAMDVRFAALTVQDLQARERQWDCQKSVMAFLVGSAFMLMRNKTM